MVLKMFIVIENKFAFTLFEHLSHLYLEYLAVLIQLNILFFQLTA